MSVQGQRRAQPALRVQGPWSLGPRPLPPHIPPIWDSWRTLPVTQVVHPGKVPGSPVCSDPADSQSSAWLLSTLARGQATPGPPPLTDQLPPCSAAACEGLWAGTCCEPGPSVAGAWKGHSTPQGDCHGDRPHAHRVPQAAAPSLLGAGPPVSFPLLRPEEQNEVRGGAGLQALEVDSPGRSSHPYFGAGVGGKWETRPLPSGTLGTSVPDCASASRERHSARGFPSLGTRRSLLADFFKGPA